MEREYSEKNGIGKKLLQFCIGAAAGIIVAAVTALILSFVMTMNFIPDDMTSIAALASQLFAAFACGFVSVRLIGSGGLLYGAISGGMLFAVQAILSLIFSSPCLLLNFIIALLIDVALSAIGGVIAVNTRK